MSKTLEELDREFEELERKAAKLYGPNYPFRDKLFNEQAFWNGVERGAMWAALIGFPIATIALFCFGQYTLACWAAINALLTIWAWKTR